jgi:hypothetical protein
MFIFNQRKQKSRTSKFAKCNFHVQLLKIMNLNYNL